MLFIYFVILLGLEAHNVPSAAYEYGSVEHWYASAMLGNLRWIRKTPNKYVLTKRFKIV